MGGGLHWIPAELERAIWAVGLVQSLAGRPFNPPPDSNFKLILILMRELGPKNAVPERLDRLNTGGRTRNSFRKPV